MMVMPVTPDVKPDAAIETPGAVTDRSGMGGLDANATEAPPWDMTWDIVDQWGAQSFPASDPPANW